MKLCVICKKCQFEEGYYYSEYTYAEKQIECMKNGIGIYADFFSQETFHKWNTFAEKCDSYDPAIG